MTTDELAVRKEFDAEISRKGNNGLFVIPATWVNGRINSYDEFSSKAVSCYPVYSNDFGQLKFSDPFAPFGVGSGKVLCFKNHSHNKAIKKQLEVVKKKRNSVEKHDDGTFFYDTGGWLMIGANVALTTAFWPQLIRYSVNDGGTLIGAIVGCVMLSLIGYLLSSLVWGTVLRYIPPIEKFRNERGVKKEKSLAIEESKVGADDEIYFLGQNAIVWEVARHNDEAALMVREKLRTNPNPDELQAWSKTVLEIFEQQSILTDGFPINLIPLMDEEAREVLEDVKNCVTNLKAEWLENQRVESLSVEHGMAVSGNSEAVQAGSRAALEGAKSFLSGISQSDVNPAALK